MKLIQGGTAWIVDDAGPRFEPDVDILIEGSVIARVGRGIDQEVSSQTGGPTVRRIDARGKLVIPGFVNAHTHAAMTLLRGYADDFPLERWLTEKIWPIERLMTPDDVYWGSLLAIVEMIRAGVTCFADMYFSMDAVAKAVVETGARAALATSVFDHRDRDEQLDEVHRFVHDWHGQADGRIRAMIAPHAPYSAFSWLGPSAQVAAELGVDIHIHLSETETEVRESLQKHGLTPIAVAEREGLFESGVLAAHCVHATEDDIEILRRHGARVAHNPTSNMKLGSGRAPIARMLERGVAVAVGTDGTASNNNLDMLEETRLAAFLAKMHGDVESLPAAVCLEMATYGGAQALGLADVGRLAPGFQADLAIVDMSGPSWAPSHDACANLIYSGSSRDVETVLVAGEVLMERGSFVALDEAAIIKEATDRGLSLARRAGEAR